jgi:hypothetical protein
MFRRIIIDTQERGQVKMEKKKNKKKIEGKGASM